MPLLPRVEPDRLQRLREQAFSRLLVEEARLGVPSKLTRRRAFALVAGAAVAGFSGTAHASPGPRSAAPQYGAPGISGKANEWRPSTTIDRAALDSYDKWSKTTALLIEPGRKDTVNDSYIYSYSRDALAVSYRIDDGDVTDLSAIWDLRSGYFYIMQAQDAFYLVQDQRCSVAAGVARSWSSHRAYSGRRRQTTMERSIVSRRA